VPHPDGPYWDYITTCAPFFVFFSFAELSPPFFQRSFLPPLLLYLTGKCGSSSCDVLSRRAHDVDGVFGGDTDEIVLPLCPFKERRSPLWSCPPLSSFCRELPVPFPSSGWDRSHCNTFFPPPLPPVLEIYKKF